MTSNSISVVIPSFNRPASLKRCLESIAESSEQTIRVLVVDDGSETPLAGSVGQIGEVTYLRTQNGGPARARNLGARAVDTEFVAFTDDDCEVSTGWTQQLVDALRAHDHALIGGLVINGLSQNPYSACSQSICDFLNVFYDAPNGNAEFFTSNNIACRTDDFLTTGGFDESFPLAAAEDREFGLRWRRDVGPLVFYPAAAVKHKHDLDLVAFWRQHFHYGRGAHHLHQVLKNQGHWFPDHGNRYFYRKLITHLFRKSSHPGMSQAFLGGLSQLAMATGYVQSALQPQLSGVAK